MPIALYDVPLLDHHCHSLLRFDRPVTAEDLRGCFTEGRDPGLLARHLPHSLFYRRAIRDLAQFLGCDPTEEAILVRRAGEAPDAYARRLFEDARFEGLLVDFGFRTDVHFDHAGLAAVVPCPVAPVLRLEALAGALVAETDTFERMVEVYGEQVNTARARGAVALKSVVAYRSGLTVAPPDRQTAKAAFDAVRRTGPAGPVRLTQKPLLDYLLWLGLEAAAAQDLPMQIHTGFGDRDLDLRLANPLHLRPILETPALSHIPIVLLHCYPYVREAAYLAHVYDQVYVDLSLTLPFAADGALAVEEALGLAPTTKVLVATDAFTLPELFWVGAHHARDAVARALQRLSRAGYLRGREAEGVGRQLLNENARRIYPVRRG